MRRSDHAKLIGDLREHAWMAKQVKEQGAVEEGILVDRAADVIESLVKERERMWKAIEKMAAAAGPSWTPRWVRDAIEEEEGDQ